MSVADETQLGSNQCTSRHSKSLPAAKPVRIARHWIGPLPRAFAMAAGVRKVEGLRTASFHGATGSRKRVRREPEETVAAFDNDDRHTAGSPATASFHSAAPHRCAERCGTTGFRGTRDSSVRAGYIDAEPSACSRSSTEMNRCPACLPVTGPSSPSQAFFLIFDLAKAGITSGWKRKQCRNFAKVPEISHPVLLNCLSVLC